ncbi:MAG: hypothetical protein ACPG8N_08225 [Rhodothermales bacterium]
MLEHVVVNPDSAREPIDGITIGIFPFDALQIDPHAGGFVCPYQVRAVTQRMEVVTRDQTTRHGQRATGGLCIAIHTVREIRYARSRSVLGVVDVVDGVVLDGPAIPTAFQNPNTCPRIRGTRGIDLDSFNRDVVCTNPEDIFVASSGEDGFCATSSVRCTPTIIAF